MKSILKEKAINLRRRGLSYSEILNKIPVAKSTLSSWLYSVGLSKKQKQRITEKKLLSIQKGGDAKRKQRILITQQIINQSKREIKNISKRELWLSGIMLYWAEGSKEKEYRPGSGVQFTNSDPQMIKLFLKWLLEIIKIDKNNIDFSIIIHENSKNSLRKVNNFGQIIQVLSKIIFQKFILKKIK